MSDKKPICPACKEEVMRAAYCNVKQPGKEGWKTPIQKWIIIGWFCGNCAHFVPRWKDITQKAPLLRSAEED